MNTSDVIGTAVSNTFRSKTRTLLTILAIFVGAFALTLTSGLGTGINSYLDDTVSGVGASNAMTVTGTVDSPGSLSSGDSGPTEYDPNAVATARPGSTVIALTPADVKKISHTEGVEKVHAARGISLDYVSSSSSKQYMANVGGLVAGKTTLLAAGAEPNNAAETLEVAIPSSYVKALGFSKADEALGATLTIGITDAMRTGHTVEAKIVGVTDEALVSPLGPSMLPNDALTNTLFELQSTGLPADKADRYVQATAWFAEDATDADIAALKDRLTDEGFTGTTVADQLGTIKVVIDGIVLVLNAFAVIALLAASFGIVNTLFMSVQERTREIGLMKAMGMGSGRVFTLFSLEAAFLGFLGSALGVVVAMAAGTALSSGLSTTLLADLKGLTLIAFDPGSIATIVLVVMGIAFLAGTLPAARAARADPVTSLRYE